MLSIKLDNNKAREIQIYTNPIGQSHAHIFYAFQEEEGGRKIADRSRKVIVLM